MHVRDGTLKNSGYISAKTNYAWPGSLAPSRAAPIEVTEIRGLSRNLRYCWHELGLRVVRSVSLSHYGFEFFCRFRSANNRDPAIYGARSVNSQRFLCLCVLKQQILPIFTLPTPRFCTLVY